MEETKEIDLKTLFQILIKHIFLIIIITIATGIAAFGITKFLMTPKYTASVSIYVNNTKDVATDRINSTDLTAAQQLVNTYMTIIKSQAVISEVAEAAQLPYTTEDIQRMLTASAIDNTEVFKVSIESESPQDAKLLANTIADVAPKIIMDYVEGSSVKIVDYASLPKKPSSPSIPRNTAIGVLLGLVISIGLSLLLSLFNTSVETEEDLEALSSYPILGAIPEFDEPTRFHKSYYQYQSYGYENSAKEKVKHE